jgi:hypothetical protein
LSVGDCQCHERSGNRDQHDRFQKSADHLPCAPDRSM